MSAMRLIVVKARLRWVNQLTRKLAFCAYTGSAFRLRYTHGRVLHGSGCIAAPRQRTDDPIEQRLCFRAVVIARRERTDFKGEFRRPTNDKLVSRFG